MSDYQGKPFKKPETEHPVPRSREAAEGNQPRGERVLTGCDDQGKVEQEKRGVQVS